MSINAPVWLLGSLLAMAVGGCTSHRPAVPPNPVSTSVPPVSVVERPGPRETRSVIVVTLDGARWQELFLGVDVNMAHRDGLPDDQIVTADVLMPNLYERVVRRGVALGAPGHGRAVEASGPNYISLPGYRELFAGAPDERCQDNDGCPPVDRVTLVDELRATVGNERDVAVIASWEAIDQAVSRSPATITMSTGRHAGGPGRERIRVNTRASQLLAEGEKADTWPGHGDYRPDRITIPLALDYQATVHPRFLFVGLGDTDEHAHADNYPAYLGALRQADQFLGSLFASLDQQGASGAATTVIITADHGRASNFRDHDGSHPESRRIFLFATGGAVPSLGYVDAGAGRRLSSIAPTVRGLLGSGDTDGAIDEPWVAVGSGAPWSSPSARLASRGAGR